MRVLPIVQIVAASYGAVALAASMPAHSTPHSGAASCTVAVYATVQDAGDTLVPALTREDFEDFEDGSAREIVQFDGHSTCRPKTATRKRQSGTPPGESGALTIDRPAPIARRK